MKTLNYNYLSKLDHLRFFAAILVIFHHCRGKIVYSGTIDSLSDLASLWLRWGSTGVSLFLVLSGFLFCIISDAGRKKIEYKSFIKNRILRIAPMATLFVFIVICINQAQSTPMDVLRLLTLQLNTGNPSTGWGHQYYPMGPIWTIAVEFQFYLLFPFLIIFMKKDGIKTISGIIIVFILIKISLVIFNGTGVYPRLYHSIIGRLDQFLIGMIAGYFYLKGYFRETNFISATMIVIALVGITAFMHFNSQNSPLFIPFSFTIEAFFWCLLIYGYVSCNIKIPKKFDMALAYLGNLSFSMYLLHLAVSKAAYLTILNPPKNNIEAVTNAAFLIIPITIILSIITFKFIEKPFLELRIKYTK
ncbi:acyltransferase [Xenorhabdus sp. TH1]|uniref:acyltransferase family protein n=1 Tax=Xenorhabdus sp. TH1 TaxID=3130166 RepID=UPI0030D2F50D